MIPLLPNAAQDSSPSAVLSEFDLAIGQDLTPRGKRLWAPFKYHPIQANLWYSPARFIMVPAGRRSGKTAIAKRMGIIRAASFPLSDGWFVFSAPIHRQAIQIYWNDLKSMVPRSWQLRRPNETDHIIYLINGSEIQVLGLDVPERLEGRPLDGIVIDEFGNCRESAWEENIRPSLSTPGRPPGWAWFIGVPEGRNHYYDMWMETISHSPQQADNEWAGFTWSSRDIMDPAEIESLSKKLDPRVFAQEVDASFESFDGAVYYTFDRKAHASTRVPYDPTKTIYVTFDFNVEPGTANVIQEGPPSPSPLIPSSKYGPVVTRIVDEVHEKLNSSTPKICQEIISRYRNHKAQVVILGDPSGGNRETSQTRGTDIDLIRMTLAPVFRDRLVNAFSPNNSKIPVKPRINSVNARLMSTDGIYHLQVDPVKCPETIKDFEGVIAKRGGTGEPDKARAEKDGRGHHADGVGYYMWRKHPLRRAFAQLSAAS